MEDKEFKKILAEITQSNDLRQLVGYLTIGRSITNICENKIRKLNDIKFAEFHRKEK